MTRALALLLTGACAGVLACGTSTHPPVQGTRQGALEFVTEDGGHALVWPVDAGLLVLGTSVDLQLTVENVGRDSLLLTAPRVEAQDPGAWYLRGVAGALAPGSRLTFGVTFAPVREGEQVARVIINHDAEAPAATAELSAAARR